MIRAHLALLLLVLTGALAQNSGSLATLPLVYVNWTVSADYQNITFKVTARTTSWIAIGFPAAGVSTTAGADAVVLSYDTVSGSVLLDDYFITSSPHASCVAGSGVCRDLDYGGLNNYFAVSAVALADTPGYNYTFSRAINTGDARDNVIPLGKAQLFWAVGLTSTLGPHGLNRGWLDVRYTGSQSPYADSVFYHQKIHGILMFISFLVLTPIGSVLARFGKALGPLWFRLHIALQTLAMLLVFAGLNLAVQFVTLRDPSSPHFNSAHAKLGIIVFIALLFSPIFGVLADMFFKPGRVSTPIFPDMLHWIISYIDILGAFATMFLGLLEMGSDWIWKGLYLGWMIAITVAYVTLALVDWHWRFSISGLFQIAGLSDD
jgi:hypothetical protein